MSRARLVDFIGGGKVVAEVPAGAELGRIIRPRTEVSVEYDVFPALQGARVRANEHVGESVLLLCCAVCTASVRVRVRVPLPLAS